MTMWFFLTKNSPSVVIMQQDYGDKPSLEVEELLASIEQGNIPLPYLLDRLLNLLIKLNEKERRLDQMLSSFSELTDLNRKINELHTLHFPAEKLKKVNRQERFLAQILTKPIRKR
jgi:hypothetical protein